jgi:two-component system, chemotaxis family, protein-glutamate methylesterase/glutaminase
MKKPIKVFAVDDSALIRRILSDMLDAHPDFDLVGTASDGKSALDRIALIKPDVITLDIQMPGMDGLETLRRIMDQMPTPVVMLSSYSKEGAEQTFQALDLGAVDFIAKPHPVFTSRIEDIREQIFEKIRTASRTPVRRPDPDGIGNVPQARAEKRRPKTSRPETGQPACVNLVSIGASAGGPKALMEIVPTLPRDIRAAFIIAQHMPPGFTGALAERLDSVSEIRVKEAKTGDAISHGTALIAEGGRNLTLRNAGKTYFVDVDRNVRNSRYRPSIDLMMTSAAEHFRERAIGVIMTGMCSDGVQGVRAIKDKNGRVIAQDETTSAVYGMNRLAVQSGAVDRVVPLDQIVPTIREMLG